MVAVIPRQPSPADRPPTCAFRSIDITDVERDQPAAVLIVSYIVKGRGTAVPVHDTEADAVSIEHGGEHAADGPLLAPYLNAGSAAAPKSLGGNIGEPPGQGQRDRANSPFARIPRVSSTMCSARDFAFLPSLLEQPRSLAVLLPLHRRDPASGEQLVSHAPDRDRAALRRDFGHGLDQLDGLGGAAPTLFD